MKNTQPLDDKLVNDLKTTFPEYLNLDGTFKFNIGNILNHKSLNLMENNLEKICFALGPGKPHFNNQHLIMEEKIPSKIDNPKPIDFCYKINYDGNASILGFIENKIIKEETISELVVSNKIQKTCVQIFESYLKPLKNYNKNSYFPNLSPKNFSISICIYFPAIYLSSPHHYYNYCNDRDSTIIERLNTYGFVMITTFINTESINSSEGLYNEINKFLKNQNNSTSALVIPELKTYIGFIQKDVYDSVSNINLITTLPQLNNLPFFNVNPASRITNTRNLSAHNLKSNIVLQKQIFSTLVRNFKQLESQKNGYDASEAYRSLGAKPREVSFYIPQTIVHINSPEIDLTLSKEEIIRQKMSQKI